MSGDSKNSIRPVVIRWLIILGITALILSLLPGVSLDTNRNRPRAEARFFVSALLSATSAYAAEYGAPVSGSSPAQILAALRGKNQREIIFFDAAPSRFNAKGELIDPWGTPYRFDLSNPKQPRIWSCGPNRKDENGAEGSDDIVSWR
jgi:type II secretory pathway pseudopilin PulG